MHDLFNAVWLAPKALQLLLLVVMFRRGLLRRFEIFGAYNLFAVLKSLVIYLLLYRNMRAAYWWTSWSLEFIELLLVLAVVFESLAVLVEPFHSIQGKIRSAFRWLLPLALLGACAVLALKPGSISGRFIAKVLALDWILISLELSAILLTFALCKSFGVGIRRFAAVILSGLAMYSAVDLVRTHSIYHTLGLTNSQFNWLSASTNAVMVVYWVTCFCLVKKQAAVPSGSMKREQDRLREWAADINDIVGVSR